MLALYVNVACPSCTGQWCPAPQTVKHLPLVPTMFSQFPTVGTSVPFRLFPWLTPQILSCGIAHPFIHSTQCIRYFDYLNVHTIVFL